MKQLSIKEIIENIPVLEVLNEEFTHDISSVEFDARKVTPGSLFVPLVGGQTDGHSYIDQAVENGAVACLWSQDLTEVASKKLTIIKVEDTLLAFQKLANYYRHLINPIVVGITGSNGKTTAKDMTAMSLATKYQVHKTQGNYNNEIGMPYTLLTMDEKTQVCVVEMGMSNFKEIELLSHIAQPDIAVVTLIGESHLEFLGSRQGIAKAKLEILSGIRDNGSFIYPGNEPLIETELNNYPAAIKTYTFGFGKNNDYYAFDVLEKADKTFFCTNLDENVRAMIPVVGAYNVNNALIALAVAQLLEVPSEQAIFQLSQFKLTANRVEWLESKQGAHLLNDAYNASPTSMKAILNTFSHLTDTETGRKKAVLGDIRELGEKSEYYHRQLAEFISPDLIDKVYLFGEEMHHLYEELQSKYSASQLFYEKSDHQILINQLETDIQPDDLVLLKSSFGVDLLQVVKALTIVADTQK